MTDFIQYWSSFRAILDGLNPYDPVVQLAIQQSVDPSITTPMMSWNPPWAFFFMSPVLILPYENALLAWRVISGILFLSSILVLDKSFKNSKAPQLLLAIPLCTMFETFVLGQLGGVITLAASLLFSGVVLKRNWMIVFGALLASVKPHIFLIFCIFLFFRKEYVKSFFVSSLLLIFLCLLIFVSNDSLNQWVIATMNPSQSVINFQSWKPASVSHLVNSFWGLRLPFLFYTALGLSLSIILIRRINPFSLGILLVISYLFSGYGWVFDQGVFAPLRLIALQFGFIPILILETLSFIARFEILEFQHEFVWYALIQVLVCVYLYKRGSHRIIPTKFNENN